jgi:hypothetical protein
MVTLLPLDGSFIRLADRFVDEACVRFLSSRPARSSRDQIRCHDWGAPASRTRCWLVLQCTHHPLQYNYFIYQAALVCFEVRLRP